MAPQFVVYRINVGVIMKLFKAIVPALAVFLAAVPVSAETFTLSCKQTPTFLATLKRSLEGMIQEEIDQTVFSDARASVQMRMLSLTTASDPVTDEDLLSGLSIHDSGDPVGLAFGLDGDVVFAPTGTCSYLYRVTILTRARDTESGDRVSTRTESTITITTPPYGLLRRN